jgi:predicted NBD/HSP70 family sugar kinase
LTASLVAGDMVIEDGFEPSTGGRPAILLRYAGHTRAVVAIYVRFDGISGALVDLDGSVRHRESLEFDQKSSEFPKDGNSTLVATQEVCDRLFAAAQLKHLSCVSMGIAVPGVVQQPSGLINHIPELGWAKLSLSEAIQTPFKIPCVVENDANALAFGEIRCGAGQQVGSLVALLLDNGFGAGIITNRELHRGAHAEAGEVAFMLTDRDALTGPVSRQGDLEDRIGASALTRQAHARGLEIPSGTLLTAQQVFSLSKAGDPVAIEMAGEILDMVAISVAAMVTILDPDLIVIGGALATDAEEIVVGISERLSGRLMSGPRLTASALGNEGVFRGVAELAAEPIRNYTSVVN